MTTTDYCFSEALLAKAAGISPKRLRELRPHLRAGEDWITNGHAIRYNRAGLERMLIALNLAELQPAGGLGPVNGADLVALEASATEDYDPAHDPAQAEAVVQNFFINPALMAARLTHNGLVIRCRYRPVLREQFRKMRATQTPFPVRHIDGPLWEAVNPRTLIVKPQETV